MPKKKRRQRGKARRSRTQRRQDDLTVDPAAQPADQIKVGADPEIREGQHGEETDVLARALRIAGFAQLVVLVSILALLDIYPKPVPQWLQPIVTNQIAFLTLCAGHAAIIGLLISTKGRLIWSTYALLIAAIATALAGHRTVGDSTAGRIVEAIIALSIVPAVWAEWFSTKIRWALKFVRSRMGLSVILIFVIVVVVAYNQSRNENYIRDWFLIPLGILTAIAISAWILWLLTKLVKRYAPILFAWIRSKVTGKSHGSSTEFSKAGRRIGHRQKGRGRER